MEQAVVPWYHFPRSEQKNGGRNDSTPGSERHFAQHQAPLVPQWRSTTLVYTRGTVARTQVSEENTEVGTPPLEIHLQRGRRLSQKMLEHDTQAAACHGSRDNGTNTLSRPNVGGWIHGAYREHFPARPPARRRRHRLIAGSAKINETSPPRPSGLREIWRPSVWGEHQVKLSAQGAMRSNPCLDWWSCIRDTANWTVAPCQSDQ